MKVCTTDRSNHGCPVHHRPRRDCPRAHTAWDFCQCCFTSYYREDMRGEICKYCVTQGCTYSSPIHTLRSTWSQ